MMSTRRFGIRWLMVGLGALAVASTVSGEAEACGGEWYPAIQIDYRVDGVARAEKALERGQHVAAAGMVIRMIPHIKQLKPKSSPLVARAIRTLAVATARNDGALPLAKELPGYVQDTWIGKSPEHVAQNLDWSIAELRKLHDMKKDDPAVETDLAEALAKVDSTKKEAREILERLAKKDLVATPEGYAALAKLRSEAGDAAGTKLALKRCEEMSEKGAVCSVAARG
jgi:hypothetical protein